MTTDTDDAGTPREPAAKAPKAKAKRTKPEAIRHVEAEPRSTWSGPADYRPYKG